MDSNTIARLCTSRALLLEAPDTETTRSRHPARVVECREGEHLLLHLARGERPLPLGTAVSVLLPADGAIWRYETTVLASGSSVRLAWPERVERLAGAALPACRRGASAARSGAECGRRRHLYPRPQRRRRSIRLLGGARHGHRGAALAAATGRSTETETRIAWRQRAESGPEDPHHLVGGTFLDLSDAAQRRIGSLVKLMKPPLLDASHTGAAR